MANELSEVRLEQSLSLLVLSMSVRKDSRSQRDRRHLGEATQGFPLSIGRRALFLFDPQRSRLIFAFDGNQYGILFDLQALNFHSAGL